MNEIIGDNNKNLKVEEVKKKFSKSKEKHRDKKQKINHKKSKYLETIDLKEEEINEIINNNHYISIIKYTKTKIKYIYKSKRKNFIYYSCHLQNNCKSKEKVDFIKENFIINNYYNNKIDSNKINYKEFIYKTKLLTKK